ncbi:phosphate ABC transporter substrate-binding protein PstS [Sorangium sp. So ce406]|uniref:phosphate ABC transporter substrate-binding protein PstS n=1 Tax=Sorangium sp. So ce406 TaxID=3133311 RepID=UPI003F5C823B
MTRTLLTLAMLTVTAACGRSDAPQDTGSLPGSNKSAGPQPTADGEITLTGAGATFPYPLYTKWISEFQKANSKVKINYQSIGSGGGIRQITERTVDFGATDAPMTEEQLAKAAGILHLPTCLGAVVLTYNLEGIPSGLKLTPDAAAHIFLGKIKKWNDPAIQKENPDVKLPEKDIATVHRSDGSGTTKIFVDYLSAVSPEWKSGPGTGTSVNWPGGLGAKGNDGVSALISSTPASIGYIELAYAMQNKLTFASLRNKSGKFVSPSLESTTAAGAGAAARMPDDLRISLVDAEGEDAYPIAGFTYILAYQEQKDLAKGKVLARFMKWAMQDGQKFTNDLHYAPLPTAVVEKVNAKLAALVGPDGKPLLAP